MIEDHKFCGEAKSSPAMTNAAHVKRRKAAQMIIRMSEAL